MNRGFSLLEALIVIGHCHSHTRGRGQDNGGFDGVSESSGCSLGGAGEAKGEYMNQKQSSQRSQSLEQVADSFLRDHLRQNPGLELVPVECHVDTKALARAATHDDVNEFLETLPHYDVREIDTNVNLHVEPEQEAVDIDLDKPEPMILARKRRHHFVYFAGFFKHRPLWTTDSRRARVFASEDEAVVEAFQFAEDDGILKEVFQDLGLQMLPAPRVLE